MQVSFLLGESIVALIADKLDKAGHDVERVVDVDELGEGSATPRPDAASSHFPNPWEGVERRHILSSLV
ncbi:hypothetical protein [Haloquadratum walsbyi]|uniref:Uncharacterized protein n=1 Tax=Haloquadratum walsbyi J07HQW2 TaxID=1238425 RepID=U1MUT6_9EURY|nr:hypothetical protein [Haloquadratum walsbyi]ERG94134.1 MAG: hypothetical protein J07HQW2_00568 [Haloquadratum walsbyi J07HQW2]